MIRVRCRRVPHAMLCRCVRAYMMCSRLGHITPPSSTSSTMTVQKGGKITQYMNYRMRVATAEGRVLIGNFLAFDKHMNLVLGDCEEFRRIAAKAKKGAAAGTTARTQISLHGEATGTNSSLFNPEISASRSAFAHCWWLVRTFAKRA